MEATSTVTGVEFGDVSGQKMVKVSNLPPDASVGETIQGLLGEMHLPPNDVSGRPLNYHARLEREGRHLHASRLTTVVVGDYEVVGADLARLGLGDPVVLSADTF